MTSRARRRGTQAMPEPFHGSSTMPAGRRLLLISYHFPPSPEVGGLRWQQLAGHAAERGWGLDVITRDPATLKAPDAGRLSTLPETIRVYGVPESPSRLERLEQWGLRLWRSVRRGQSRSVPAPPAPAGSGPRPGSIHRSQVRWFPPTPRKILRAYHAWSLFVPMRHWGILALGTAREVLDPDAHAAIISCGPPHPIHEAARRLAAESGLPHIVDLRDPWSLQERLLEPKASPLYFHIERWYERKSMATAALVVSNTAPATAALSSAYPRAPGRFLTVLNGYDDDPVPGCPPRSRFVIAYAGSIYYDRNPRLLFRAVSRVARSQTLTAADIGLHFVGNVERFDGVSLTDMAREEGVEHLLTVQSRLPRQELFGVLEGASMLVSLPQDSHMAIPSKVYEYMTFHATLLVMAEHGSATARLLEGSRADVVGPHDVDMMTEVIAERYEEFRAGKVPVPLAADRSFSRAEQARILFDAIEDVTTGVSAPARSRSPAAAS